MSPVLGNLIVLLVLAAVVALAVRSLWRSHKRGGHCNGDCASCGCCPQITLARDTSLEYGKAPGNRQPRGLFVLEPVFITEG